MLGCLIFLVMQCMSDSDLRGVFFHLSRILDAPAKPVKHTPGYSSSVVIHETAHAALQHGWVAG